MSINNAKMAMTYLQTWRTKHALLNGRCLTNARLKSSQIKLNVLKEEDLIEKGMLFM